LVKRNEGALNRILADDFIEIGASGKQYSKSDAINYELSGYVSNEIDSLTIRFYGDAAIAFGSEIAKKNDGSRARNLWTIPGSAATANGRSSHRPDRTSYR
jgi:hypothetical protein